MGVTIEWNDNYGKKIATWRRIRKEYLEWRKSPEFRAWFKKKWIKQAGRCIHCFEPMEKPTVEHMKPVYHGGTNDKQNLNLACWPCNETKGAIYVSHRHMGSRRRLFNQKLKAVIASHGSGKKFRAAMSTQFLERYGY